MKKYVLSGILVFIVTVGVTCLIRTDINYFGIEYLGNNFSNKNANTIQNSKVIKHNEKSEMLNEKENNYKQIAYSKDKPKNISSYDCDGINVKLIVSNKRLKDVAYEERNNLTYYKSSEKNKNIDINKYLEQKNKFLKLYKRQEEINNDDTIQNLENKDMESKPVFKVQTSQIIGSLTMMDKIRLFEIAQKLNVQDYIKIEELLKAQNQKQGIIDALHLLRIRLSDKDYQKIRDIADRFVDMDAIEQKK